MRPNAIIIGAMKCGTSSLHRYLQVHPQIFMSTPKELRFFTKHWKKGIGWYESKFDTDRAVRGESSPQYTQYPRHPDVPARMHSVVPDARLIYLVRDPIDRVVSHYLERLGQLREHRELSSLLTDFESDKHAQMQYINPSKYWQQIERYLKFYPADRILVLALEDLQKRRLETLRQVFRFLAIDDSFWHESFDKVWNESSVKRRASWVGELIYPPWLHRTLHRRNVPRPIVDGFQGLVRAIGKPIERPKLSPAVEARMIDCFRSDVESLRAFTGKSFADWRQY
jgi:hypothetical protein